MRGQKDFFPDDSDKQRQCLEESLNEHWSLVSEERVERLGSLVKASWIPDNQVVELQTPAGKFWQTMGFSTEGKQYLLPEEALYLMECGNVQVFYKDLPLSIQDGYEMFLSSKTMNLLQYQVFAHLKRLGYVVHRFDPSHGGEEDKKPESASLGTPEAQTATVSSAVDGRSRTWWMTDDLRDSGRRSDPGPPSGSSRWDFRSICFPDVGSRDQKSDCFSSPDPALLPRALTVGVCDIAPWRQRINLQKVKMSAKEQKREKDKRRRHWDVNRDREVRRCRNWSEYRELLARRQAKPRNQPDHLWNREVTPLHDPTEPLPHGKLLEKISVIKSTNLLEGASRLKSSDEWRISFNVYQPDTVADFKKSNPGKPYSRMCVCSFNSPVPDLQVMKVLAFQSGDIPVVFAVVDHGDISFYTFKDFQLPTDVFP
uniref:tRNA-splicing endonuclease subunit Sen54 N-terminal domain-containing protein n=1 Tax=Sphaeramia orbicularis TaxID=375764 RepID=A0A673AEF8_9TELE